MYVKYFNFDIVSSTNDIAINELKTINDINTAVVVTANIQQNGRGRNNKIWFNGQNNLYYTLGIKHYIDTLPIYLMQVIGGLSVYKTLSNNLIDKKNVYLKYPNDIYIKTNNNIFKKIAGIISEHIFSYNSICSSIIGIGINNKQKEFPENINATSLFNLDVDIENDELTKQLTDNILQLINDKENILDIWKEKLNLDNKKIKIIDNISSKEIAGEFILDKILEDCRLLVVDNAGNKRIIDNGDSIKYDLNDFL